MSGKSQSKRSHAADKPLAGERVLITRAKDQAGSLAEELEALGAAVVEIPAIEIRPPASYVALDATLNNIENYDWLILTSVNGVEALFARMEKLGFGPEKLLHLNIAAIGPATREKIEEHGLPVDVVPEKYVAESVVEALWEQVRGQRVLLVRAKVGRDVIPEELRKAGARVHVVEAYETVVPEESRARLQKVLGDPRTPDGRDLHQFIDGSELCSPAGFRRAGQITSRHHHRLYRPSDHRHAARTGVARGR